MAHGSTSDLSLGVPGLDRGSTGNPRPSRGPVGRRILFCFLTLVFLGLMTGQSRSSGLERVVLPFALALALQFLPFFWSEKADPFEPPAFFGLYQALALLSTLSVMIASGKVQVDMMRGASQATVESLVAIVGWAYVVSTIAYFVGYYSRLGSKFRRWTPTRIVGASWDERRTLVAVVVCLLIAAPAYAAFQARVGGSLLDITRLAEGKAALRDDPTATWIWRGVQLGLLAPMIVLAAGCAESRRSKLIVSAVMIVFGGILVLRLGGRGIVVYFLATCAAIFHYLRRRIPTGLIVGGVFVALVAANLLLDYRTTSDPRNRPGISAERLRPAKALEEHEEDRNRLSTLVVVFHTFPERHEYLLGQSWYVWAVAPLPSWIWPDKAKAFVWRETFMMLHLRGAPVPVPYLGLLYSNFAWVGIVLGMFAWGVFQRVLYQWLCDNSHDRNVVLLYANLIHFTSPTLFAFQVVIQSVIPAFLILLFVGYRTVFHPSVTNRRGALAS